MTVYLLVNKKTSSIFEIIVHVHCFLIDCTKRTCKIYDMSLTGRRETTALAKMLIIIFKHAR
jgi:competence transcription factor ComK